MVVKLQVLQVRTGRGLGTVSLAPRASSNEPRTRLDCLDYNSIHPYKRHFNVCREHLMLLRLAYLLSKIRPVVAEV